ncbi:hypothetical protein [Schaalia hyovaginalis]|uniref:WXG100 family type VII secretion target n=1 Tax=Schaalia hyovaginalis TaxID=29316 RepID=A0A923IZP6_9ACTO|nr:hypothetical protein [Schaalia hyovaginalis]MBB6335556.1 hypothetical protein [Schaalia hyovaginalis]
MSETSALDTYIEGSHSSLLVLADWLNAAGRVFEQEALYIATCRELAADWQGRAAQAYETSAWPMKEHSYNWAQATKGLGDRVLAYAEELFDRQRDMSDIRFRAREHGLHVVDYTIYPPDPIEELPAFSTSFSSEEKDAYSTTVSRNALLRDQWKEWSHLVKDAERARSLLSNFIDTLTQDLSEIVQLPDVESLLTDLGFSFTEEVVRSAFEARAQIALSRASAAAVQNADQWVQLGLTPPAAITAGRNSRTATTLASQSQKLISYAEWASRVGTVSSFIMAGTEIASGESPGSVGSGLLGAEAGGFIAGTLESAGMFGSGAALPLVATVALTVGGAVAAREGYESLIPLRTRRKLIDEPTNDLVDLLRLENRRAQIPNTEYRPPDAPHSFLHNPGGTL